MCGAGGGFGGPPMSPLILQLLEERSGQTWVRDKFLVVRTDLPGCTGSNSVPQIHVLPVSVHVTLFKIQSLQI